MSLYLRPRGRGAPFACAAAVSTGGSDWISGPVSFLIGAWYSRSEHDFTTFVPLNWVWSYSGVSLTESSVSESALHGLSAAPGSSFSFSWSRPSGRQPDHYSIYWMPGPLFSPVTPAVKVLPSSGLVHGNIPGSATSALVLSGSSRTQLLAVPVVATHANGVHIPGNRAMSFTPTSSVSLSGVSGIPDGLYNVDDAEVDWTADGPITALTLSGVSGVTPIPAAGICRYDCGPLNLRITASGGYRPVVFISLEQSLQLSAQSVCEPDAYGRLQPQSMLPGWPYRRIGFELAYGGLAPGSSGSTAPGEEAGALSRLHTWARTGTEVELVDSAGWSNAQYFVSPSAIRWFGTLEAPSHPGTTHRWGDAYRFALRVDGMQPLEQDRGWFAVRAVATGAGGSFEIDGDETALFSAGLGFYVAGSTGNDKPYCVASSSYSSATNRTTVVVTGNVPSAVADGRVEVQDW